MMTREITLTNQSSVEQFVRTVCKMCEAVADKKSGCPGGISFSDWEEEHLILFYDMEASVLSFRRQ